MLSATYIGNEIRVLSDYTISRIAAGEVLESPTSALKELLENAIDAGATKIEIGFDRGGRNLIMVRDNGCGVSKKELPLVFCRHATSKLSDECIEDVRFMGFRGEALAAISSVSRTTITTKTRTDCSAWQMSVNGVLSHTDIIQGNYSEPIPVSHGVGTTVMVKDLFFSTPNRLKFLRSEQFENALCIDIVQRIAISHHNIAFFLSMNGKRKFACTVHGEGGVNTDVVDDCSMHDNCGSDNIKHADPAHDHTLALEQRIVDILGREFYDNSVSVNYNSTHDADITIRGRVSFPTYSTASSFGAGRKKQYCYVNQRVVKDELLYNIVRAAYDGLIMRGTYPIVVLFIDVPSRLLDVNIHPNKLQIRFWNERYVRSVTVNTMRDALYKAPVSNLPIEQLIHTATTHKERHTTASMYTERHKERVDDPRDTQYDESALSSVWEELSANTANGVAGAYFDDETLVLRTSNRNKHSTEATIENQVHSASGVHSTEIGDIHNNENNDLPQSGLQSAEPQHTDHLGAHSTTKLHGPCQTLDVVDDSTVQYMGQAVSQICDTYIVSVAYDGIIITDQHAAHERIVLESMKQRLTQTGQLVAQPLLLPQIVHCGNAIAHQLMEIAQSLKKVGITISMSDDGPDAQVAITTLPKIIGVLDVTNLLLDIAEDPELYEQIMCGNYNRICSTLACHSSIRSGRNMTIDEMNELLRSMEKTCFSSQCNHGRPTYIKISDGDMRKIFQR